MDPKLDDYMPFFQDIVYSPTTLLLIGKDETPIRVHTNALIRVSNQFIARFDADKREHRAGKRPESTGTKIDDVEVDTFALFLEYAYTGDYKLPTPSDIREAYAAHHKNLTGDSYEEYAKFTNNLIRGVDEAPSYLKGVTFTKIFISHARLYVYALQMDVKSLQKKVVRYLQASFKFFPLCEERCEDIARLAYYVYTNGYIPRKFKHRPYDPFKLALLEFCVANREMLQKHHGFKVVSGYPNFKEDFSAVLKLEEHV